MTTVQANILDKTELNNNIKYHDIELSDLISADNYNEPKLLKKFLSYDEREQRLLFKCALQISIIGYGNKNYGFIRSDDEVLSVTDVFNSLKINYNKGMGQKYDEDELSARRLIRLLRCQIQKYIKEKKRPSYLWLKYAEKTEKTIEFSSFCFPSGEHLVENKEQADFMMTTYKNLDDKIGSKFCERLKRVFIAMGIYQPSFLDNT